MFTPPRLTFRGIDQVHSDIPENNSNTTSVFIPLENTVVNTSNSHGAFMASLNSLHESGWLDTNQLEDAEDQPTLPRFFMNAESIDRDITAVELAEKAKDASQIDTEIDFNEVRKNYEDHVSKIIDREKTERPKNNNRRRANYLQMRELDQEKSILVTSTVIDPDGEATIDDILVTVIKKKTVAHPRTGKDVEIDIFVKQLPGKSWEECTPEELEIISKTDIKASDILSKISKPEGVYPIFFIEYPVPGREKPIRTFGSIGFDGEVKIMDVRRDGFGTGQYPCEFLATAMTSLRGGLSANIANQMRVAVGADLENWLLDYDFVFSMILDPMCLPGSQKQMQNLMDKLLQLSEEQVYLQLSNIEATTLCFDTKGIKYSKSKKDKSSHTREVLTLLGAGKYDKDDIAIAACATLKDKNGSEKSGESLAGTIRGVLEQIAKDPRQRKEIYKKIIASCFDTTSSNTGWRSGACEILQHVLERCILQLGCRNHTADTCAKHGMFFSNFYKY